MSVGVSSKESWLMHDDKGFSLVELVIVIAIIAILGSVLAYSFSMVTGQHARECANDLSTSLDKAKNYALTRSGSAGTYMELSKKTDGGYVVRHYVPSNPVDTADTATYVQLEEENVGKAAVEITCYQKDGSSFEISETNSIRIYYDRVTGAFKEAVAVIGGSEQKDYCTKIEIKRGRTYQITLITATGKHQLERIS